jgi:predicted nucleic acid-binding protein
MQKKYVIDSFALLAYLQKERFAAQVLEIIESAEKGTATLWLSIINYGEVIYITERVLGLETARKTIALIDQLPIEVVEADRKLTFAAAHIKANYSISYADAFSAALAIAKDAAVVTADPEFKRIEKFLDVHWLK